MSITLQGNAFSNFSLNKINSTPAGTPASTPANLSFKSSVFDQNFPATDIFQPVTQPKTEQKAEPVKIGMARIIFNRLTQEQIDTINQTRELPKNAKFKDGEISGEPTLTWNLLDWSAGTHKLPQGYELKKDILGFTHTVREGTQAWWLKKAK